jgi:hypothetical protein
MLYYIDEILELRYLMFYMKSVFLCPKLDIDPIVMYRRVRICQVSVMISTSQ